MLKLQKLRNQQSRVKVFLRTLRDDSQLNEEELKKLVLHSTLDFPRKSQGIRISQQMMELLRQKTTTISGNAIHTLEALASASAVN